jgi:hypothetical protein
MGTGCAKADEIEACATDAAGCTMGCTAAVSSNLLKFVTCMESPGPEMVCHPERAQNCSTGNIAGGYSAIQTCLADKAKLRALEAKLNKEGGNINRFPELRFNMKTQEEPFTKASIKKGLCKAGVKPAC